MTISATNVAEFPFTTNCPATLPAQAACTITIHFTPTALGLRVGTLNIVAGGGISAALPESGTAAAPVTQLAFGTPPAAIVALGGNAGSSVTVIEKNSSGNVVAPATDTITLTVASPGGYSKVHTATAVTGVAVFNLSGNALVAAGGYTYTATISSNTSAKSAVAPETVDQAAATVSVATNNSQALLQSAVTFTTTVSATTGTPTGSIEFFDGSIALGPGTLSAGVATFTTSSLAAGSHTITAVYSGDANYTSTISNPLAQTVIDFALSASNTNGKNGTSQTVIPGGAATYSIAIAPTMGTEFPTITTLTVTGLPPGATAALTTSPWTQLTSTSWQLPAKTTLANVSLVFDTPSQAASVRTTESPARGLPPILWALLLAPFAGKIRRAGKRLGKTICLLLILASGAAAITAISGCGSENGFFGQTQKTYIVTVTVTTGLLSHSTDVTLIVQ